MKKLYYISRNFTEFGGFSASEILDFNSRRILRSTDYVRLHDTDEWKHLKDWLSENEQLSTSPPKAKVPSVKKAVAKPKPKKIPPIKN